MLDAASLQSCMGQLRVLVSACSNAESTTIYTINPGPDIWDTHKGLYMGLAVVQQLSATHLVPTHQGPPGKQKNMYSVITHDHAAQNQHFYGCCRSMHASCTFK